MAKIVKAELRRSDRPTEGIRGDLHVTTRELRFEPDSEAQAAFGADPDVGCSWPLDDDLEMRLGGAADNLIFFSHPLGPGQTLFTQDTSILDHQALGHRRQASKVRRQRSWLKISLGVGVLGIILWFGLLLAGTLWLVKWSMTQISPEMEVELGDGLWGAVESQMTEVDDPLVQVWVRHIMEPLLLSADGESYPFEVHVVLDEQVNAFAFPGGHMVLNSGLILEAGSAAEVQAVLAHEMAHVTRRHSLESMLTNLGMFALLQGILGDATLLAELVTEGGFDLASSHFSREQELEADAVGWDHLKRAGVETQAMITLLERLEGGGVWPWLESHPSSEERVAHLLGRVTTTGGGGQVISDEPRDPQDFVRIQEQIRNFAKAHGGE